MKNLTHTAAINKSTAAAMVFDACRANASRKTWEGIFAGVYYVTTFQPQAEGGHKVTVRNEDREVIATALVDEFDN
jgi:hypothetical protein